MPKDQKLSKRTLKDLKKGKGTKDDIGKATITLLDPNFIIALSEHMKTGMLKYIRGNWQLDLDPERILNAIYRHALAIHKGEVFDKETGSRHSIAIGANSMMLNYAERHNNIVITEHDKG